MASGIPMAAPSGGVSGSQYKNDPNYKPWGGNRTYGTNVYYRVTPEKSDPKPKPKPAPSSSGGGGGSGGGSGGGTFDRFESDANKVKPKLRDVQPEDTVKQQIEDLLAQESLYMQRARYAGEKMAQQRGLQNTSMAAEASQAAAVDRAFPIAAQDANTYFSQGINNQNTENRFLENKQNFYQSLALGEQSFLNNRTLLGDELANRLELARVNGLSSIFSQPGLTAQQQEFAVGRFNSLFSGAPISIQRFGFI